MMDWLTMKGVELFTVSAKANGKDIELSVASIGTVKHVMADVLATNMYSGIPLDSIVSDGEVKTALFAKKPLVFSVSFHLYCVKDDIEAATDLVLQAVHAMVLYDAAELEKLHVYRLKSIKAVEEILTARMA